MEKERGKKVIRKEDLAEWRRTSGRLEGSDRRVHVCRAQPRRVCQSVERGKTTDWVQCVLRKVQESRTCGRTL